MPKSIIPFELARLNEGDAFSLPSGIFTAPVNGIYHFQFSAVKPLPYMFLDVFLQVNGANIAPDYTVGDMKFRNHKVCNIPTGKEIYWFKGGFMR